MRTTLFIVIVILAFIGLLSVTGSIDLSQFNFSIPQLPRQTELNEDNREELPAAFSGLNAEGQPTQEGCASGELTGMLSAIVDAQGNATTWTCTLSSSDICQAGPDGVWTQCTFEPSLRPWPTAVAPEALAHPDQYTTQQ